MKPERGRSVHNAAEQLRTADQRHFGLLTNCGLGDLLRIDDWCGLRTSDWFPNPQLVSQSAISQQSAVHLVRNAKSAIKAHPILLWHPQQYTIHGVASGGLPECRR